MMTSNRKGQIAVSKAQVRAIELGYAPAIPVMDCRYDLVLDDGDKLWRVQVKSSNRIVSHSKGSIAVNLSYETRKRRTVLTYKRSEVDALVVYLPIIDRLCWFPPEVFVNKTALTVRIDPPLNGQSAGIIMASKYFW